MAKGIRDPSSHRSPEQIKKMDHGYNARASETKKRSNDAKARRILNLDVGDPRDAGHIKSQNSGGKTTKCNLHPQSRHSNRGWERNKGNKP